MAGPKAFSVFWTDTAAKDLQSIVEHIAAESVSAACAVLDRIEGKAARLRSLPRRGRIVPELAEYAIQSYRELIVDSWRIVYRIEGNRVWVLAVLDARRSVEDLLLDRFLR